jgi:glutamine amidotransferase
MCRLFGQHAHPGLDVAAALCSAPNALRFQSHRHPHGWGVGWYEHGSPRVRRGVLPAHEDEAFAAAAGQARSRVVLAHVREKSVGEIALENTHPFQHGSWLFAHNGTVARWKTVASVRAAIEDEIDADLRGLLAGATDSERLFLVFLTRLRGRARLDRAGLEDVRRALRETVATVAGHADRPPEKPSSLNLLVSDGRVLAACRRGRTLHLALDAGPQRALVVASEPIGAAARWEEIPEGGFAGTEDGAVAVCGPLRGRTRARVKA